MHIGIIASMKAGLEHFIYREVCALAERNAVITLFPTKHGSGLYNPPTEWNTQRWRAWSVVLCQPWRFLSMPARYLSVLFAAIRYGAIVDFLLAAHFLPRMRHVDAVYATFADRKLFVGYFCKLLLNKPLAVEIHAYELYDNPNPRLLPVALAACDRIIAATEYNREVLQDRYAVSPRRVEVVRYSIDLDEYRPASKFVVLIVAFFVEKKGHEILFEAVKKLDRDDVEVWVVGGTGGSSSEVDVRGIVKRLGMESQVAFFGKLSGAALKAVYRACDVFCLPSRFDSNGEGEGFPNAIIEAMACGKPVVTTRHVEIPRIVDEIVVDENDVDALAEALRRVCESSQLREQLGERNRQLAEEHFSPRNVGRTFRLLQEIAKPAAENSDLSISPSSSGNASNATTRRETVVPVEQATCSAAHE